MPNKVCYFGCNKFEKQSVFNVPKDHNLKKNWMKSLEVEHLSTSDVICEKHFKADAIKRKNDIFDELGNLVCSAPLLRPRLQPYAVPHLFSARKRLKFEETTEHETEVLLIKDISISSNFGICDVLELPIQKISFIESKQELDKIAAILLDHNYSTINNVNFHPDPNANIAIDTSEFNISLDNREDAYDLINSWELKLPQKWHKYLSNDKKLIGISEIIFLKNGKHTNSFLRKNIIIDMNLKVTCNILGKNICNDKLQNSINKILIQEHLENIIREVATVKICRGLDLHSKNLMLSSNGSIMVDTLLKYRNSNCPITIPHGYYCLFCSKSRKAIRQRSCRCF